MNGHKYPLGTLAEAVGMTVAELGRQLNISGSTLADYRDNGMSELVADRRAAQCGLVAWQVWPEMLEHAQEAAEEAERERKRHKAALARAAYWRAPERHRERLAQYRQSSREALRLYRRRYYQQNREQEIARTAAYKRRLRQEGKRGDIDRDVKDVA